MKKTALVSFTIAGLVAAGFTAFYPKSVKSEDLAPKPAKSDQLVEIDQKSPNPAKPAWDKPLISATTDITLNRPQSIVYCPTITVAWQEVQKHFETDTDHAFIERLNHEASEFKQSALPEGNYYADSGAVAEGIINRVNQKHKELFSETINLENSYPDDYLMYCALKDEINFPTPFEDLDYQNFDTHGESEDHNYKYWGMDKFPDTRGHQVKVISYTPDNYTLKFPDKSGDKAIILSMFAQPPEKLDDAIKLTAHRIQTWQNLKDNKSPLLPAPYSYDDKLSIPELSLKQTTTFEQLLGLYLFNTHKQLRYRISKAQQMVAFTLTRSGAKLASYAFIHFQLDCIQPPSRNFYFNRPFLCTMWKDGEAMPYLAVWVNGPDVLVN